MNNHKGNIKGPGPGRPSGSANKITQQIKEAFAMLLEGNLDKMSAWLEEIGKEDPMNAMRIMMELSERFVPKLARTEVTGKDGERLIPAPIMGGNAKG
jgi:hypothetical protein